MSKTVTIYHFYLPCNVPQLQPDLQLVVVMDQLKVEVDAERCAVVSSVAEEVVDVPPQDGALAGAHLSDDDDLQIIEINNQILSSSKCTKVIFRIFDCCLSTLFVINEMSQP